MLRCYNCEGETRITGTVCPGCGLSCQGEFETPRLARLSAGEQQLVEALILNGGNLSRTTEAMQISYPTLRKRVDTLIERVLDLRRADSERIEAMLAAVEAGELPAEAAARRIKEIGGDT